MNLNPPVSLTALIRAVLLVGIVVLQSMAVAAEHPEPGPEDGGLRLRLNVEPLLNRSREGFDVRIDVENVSNEPMTLQSGWEDEDAGSVMDYLEAATSIECYPAIAPWRGGLPARVDEGRKAPQPTHVLKPGETLSASWKTGGRALKNRVSEPFHVHNPTFPLAGLYSVHATLNVMTHRGTAHLRSNEQLVSVGGSRAMPRHTYGPLWSVNGTKRTATLGLGSQHQVAVGDQFEMTSKQSSWMLTITEVSNRYSDGTLQRLDDATDRDDPQLPTPQTHAILREPPKGK